EHAQRLLHLDALDVVDQHVDLLVDLHLRQWRRSASGHRTLSVHERVTPDRHFTRAMTGRRFGAVNEVAYLLLREYPAIVLLQHGQIGRLLLERSRYRTIANGVHAMALSTILPKLDLARSDRTSGAERRPISLHILSPGRANESDHCAAQHQNGPQVPQS
ncbi:MAG: hypothetical protein ACRETL_16560, partial [Gammaproteobacteria bacterium]